MYFRSLLILSVFTASTSCAEAQVVNLHTENFNNGFPAAWTRIDADGLTPHSSVSFVNNAWVVTEDIDSTGTGDSAAVATSYYSPAGTANDWMISPAITLKGHGNFLSWQARSFDPSYPDGYNVYVSNTLPAIDSFMAVPLFFQTDFELPEWTNREVSLDTFASQTVYIAFRAKSEDQYLLLIDNIRVYADTTLSVSENAAREQVNVYPNPVSDVVNVSGTSVISDLMLLDLSGRVMARYRPGTSRCTLDLQAYGRGLYILQVGYASGQSRQVKIIKQ